MLTTSFPAANGKLADVRQPSVFTGEHAHVACVRVAKMIRFYELGDRKNAKVKRGNDHRDYFAATLRPVVFKLARFPLVNSFVMVPSSLWRPGHFDTAFDGSFGTKCATPSSDELRDVEVLNSFVYRIKHIGWISRVQFEELWMSLLGVLSIVQNEEVSGGERRVCDVCDLINASAV